MISYLLYENPSTNSVTYKHNWMLLSSTNFKTLSSWLILRNSIKSRWLGYFSLILFSWLKFICWHRARRGKWEILHLLDAIKSWRSSLSERGNVRNWKCYDFFSCLLFPVSWNLSFAPYRRLYWGLFSWIGPLTCLFLD